MPSRKQRRRREKNFRHEYETVLLDDEGNEVPLDPEKLRAERESRERSKPARAASGQKQPRGRAQRMQREVPPPSWNRAFRRGGMMGSVMLVAFVFLFKSAPIAVRLAWGIFYAVAFVPLTYWIDRFAYRSYVKRSAKKT